MATTAFNTSLPPQQAPNPLIYDAIKEALKNKTLREAMIELKIAHLKLDLSVKKLEQIWVPSDIMAFKRLSSEDDTGEGNASLGEEEIKKEATWPRSVSWISIDQWIRDVEYASESVVRETNRCAMYYSHYAGNV